MPRHVQESFVLFAGLGWFCNSGLKESKELLDGVRLPFNQRMHGQGGDGCGTGGAVMFTHDKLNLLAMCVWSLQHFLKYRTMPSVAPTVDDLAAMDPLLDKIHTLREEV
jgi:hypothetical protein